MIPICNRTGILVVLFYCIPVVYLLQHSISLVQRRDLNSNSTFLVGRMKQISILFLILFVTCSCSDSRYSLTRNVIVRP